MPEGSRNNETNPTGSTEVDKLAEKIGGVAGRFTEEQAAVLNTPVMRAKLEQWQSVGHLNNGAFIAQLAAIAQEKAETDAASSPTPRLSRGEVASVTAEDKDKEPLLKRFKKLGKGGIAAVVGAGAIMSGIGVMAIMENNDDRVSYVMADVEAHTISPNASEAEMIAFFNLTPTTHDQTKETPDTKDDFNFRPTREALFSYNGSKESIKMVMDDMSDMFRRDVRVQAAWASALKAEGAPQVPSVSEIQDEGIYYNYHQELYQFTDKMARDVTFRTAVYNDMIDTLKKSMWSEQIQEATADQISVQHDGNRVSIAKRVGDRGREAQYISIDGHSLKGEKVNVMYKIDCGQWMLIARGVEIPAAAILDQPREVVIPPTVTETPPPPATETPQQQPPVEETPPPEEETPPPTETTPPPPTTQPPHTTQPPVTLAPKREADIPDVPVPVRGLAPRIDIPAAPPPPPPAPVYRAPIEIAPPVNIFSPAPGSVPGKIWNRGQGSTPSIPRNPILNPPSRGGDSGPTFNQGMIDE